MTTLRRTLAVAALACAAAAPAHADVSGAGGPPTTYVLWVQSDIPSTNLRITAGCSYDVHVSPSLTVVGTRHAAVSVTRTDAGQVTGPAPFLSVTCDFIGGPASNVHIGENGYAWDLLRSVEGAVGKPTTMCVVAQVTFAAGGGKQVSKCTSGYFVGDGDNVAVRGDADHPALAAVDDGALLVNACRDAATTCAVPDYAEGVAAAVRNGRVTGDVGVTVGSLHVGAGTDDVPPVCVGVESPVCTG